MLLAPAVTTGRNDARVGEGMLTRLVASADAWQRQHAPGGFPVAVLKKFGDDRASNLAALIAYYAFFSLFPLLLAFVSILGFVLEDDPALRQDVLDATLARIPVIGAELRDDVQPLTGSGVALAIGLVGTLWAGLGVTLALGQAFAEIWDTPRLQQPGGLTARARGLALLAILGATLVAATVTAGLAIGGGIGPAAERGAAVVGSLAVNLVAFLTVFALLTPRPRHVRDLLPGVGLAAIGALALQSLGGWYVDHVIVDASAVYGTFAIVIGLLTWFWLVAHLLLVAAEVNVVLRWHLWPRALTGELEPADRLALRRFAEATRRDRREQIAVSFDDGDDRTAAPD
jgi:YihY family inner membrane protein